MLRYIITFCILFIALVSYTTTQQFDGHRTINITFDTYSPMLLGLNRGRVLWMDRNPDNSTYYLKYYSGAEIITLDSNLNKVNAAIDGDFIVWINDTGKARAYNIRSWEITELDEAYYSTELYSGPSLSNGLVAYTLRDNEGTKILLKNLITGKDTTFDEGVWNMRPIIHHGQLAWTVSDMNTLNAPSNIYFYDGNSVRNITNTINNPNLHILKDGLLAWLQGDLSTMTTRVMYYDGDSVFTIENFNPVSKYPAGLDVSDGIIVYGVTDILTSESTIKIFNTESNQLITLSESEEISSLQIDNNWVVWAVGSGFQKQLRIYHIDTGNLDSLGATDAPLVDDEQIAWTFGDAIELRIPLNYTRITNNGNNGWSQSRFVNNDHGNIVYGNYNNSTNARLSYWNRSESKQLNDSTLYKDFIMVNDGYAIWREDTNILWLYDGKDEPQKIIDSLQCENMYVAGGYIGFHGFRTDAGNNINQAWIYDIQNKTLKQITNDTSKTVLNGITLVEDGNAVWFRDDGTETMLMYYDGTNIKRITSKPINDQFAFNNGNVVCSEDIDGVYQIVIYHPNENTRQLLTNGNINNAKPFSDGKLIAWFQGDSIVKTLCYYDIEKKLLSKVARTTPVPFRWLWMSNGKFSWQQGKEICVYDGNVITQFTNSGSTSPNNEPYLDNEILLWKQDNPTPSFPQYGDIYTGKLHAHVAFDAEHIVGEAPLEVSFYSRAWQGINSLEWDFGDGEKSNEESPVHIYTKPGVYSVTLTATGPTGSSNEMKRGLVRVLPSTSMARENIAGSNSILNIFPNPITTKAMIEYNVPLTGKIKLMICDVFGNDIANFTEINIHSDFRVNAFDGLNNNGEKIPSGIYFVLLYNDGNLVAREKMIIIR